MKAVLVALVALYAVAALASVDYALDQKIVEHVNSDPQSTWVAGPNDRFAGVTLQEASRLLGARRVPSRLPRKVHAPRAIPESFDARTQCTLCVRRGKGWVCRYAGVRTIPASGFASAGGLGVGEFRVMSTNRHV